MPYTNLDDFLRDLPQLAATIADRLRGHDLLFLVETKQGRRQYIQLQNGQALLPEETDRKPDCTVKADESVLLDIIAGRLNPAKALLLRRMSVSGNVQALMSLIALI